MGWKIIFERRNTFTRRLRITNPLLEKTYRTYLGADYSSGVTLTVASNVSFADNDLLVIGEPREESSELKKMDSKTGVTTITLASALNFAHSKSTPVYKSMWDQVVIESRSSSAGSFATLTTSAIQWDNSDNETIYYDTNGTDAYEYRFRFYNSVTLQYSEYSVTITGAGPARNSVSYMLDRVRELTQDTENKIASDDEIIRAFNRAQDIIYAHNPKYWFLKVDTFETGSGSVAATASTGKYTLANLTNFGELAYLKYRYNSGGIDEIYRLRKVFEAEFDRYDSDQNATSDDWPEIYKMIPADSSSSNGYFKITPKIANNSVGTFYPVYYEKMANLDTVEDTTQVLTPDLLIDYGISYVERIKGNETKAKLYEASLVSDSENITPKGLIMLDKMDNAQKDSVDQPRSVWNFRGQKAVGRLYGNRSISITTLDQLREDQF